MFALISNFFTATKNNYYKIAPKRAFFRERIYLMARLIIILLNSFFLTVPFSTQCKRAPRAPLSSEKVDFFTSMGWEKESSKKTVQELLAKKKDIAKNMLERLQLLKALYDKNMFTEKKQGKSVIPKIIHQIWVGPKDPPAIFKDSQESLKKYHPDWEYKLWTDEDIPALKLYNQKYYDLSTNFGAKADILRYELLYRYGGIYLDVDFICLKPLDVLLQYDLWAAIMPVGNRGGVGNSTIGCVPGHPIMEDAILTLGESYNTYKKTKYIVEMVGPRHFQRSFMKFADSQTMNIIALPASFFFPISIKDRRMALEAQSMGNDEVTKSFIKSETFAMHYWAGSWWNKRSSAPTQALVLAQRAAAPAQALVLTQPAAAPAQAPVLAQPAAHR